MAGLERYGVRRILGRRLLILGPLFCVAFLAVFWVGFLLILGGITGEPSFPSIDFYAFWAGSSLALDGRAADAYEAVNIWRVQRDLPGDDNIYQVWLNPPVFFLLVLPLSLLPVALSLGTWVLATGGLALSAVRRLSRSGTVLMLALAFPANFYNMVIGQNGFLTAGLFAWGMLLLKDRPVLAGALLGLIAYKPQFLPLVLLALLVSGQRRAAVSAVSSTSILCLLSIALFGFEPWEAFFSLVRSGDSIYTTDGSLGVSLAKMQSVSASLLLLGASPVATQAVQVGITLASAGFVVWLWRKDFEPEYKAAGLAVAVLLATPYSYHYDLTLMGIAALFLGLQFQKHGWQIGDAEVLLLAWATPLLGLVIGLAYGVAIGPAVMLLLLAVLLRRVRRPADQVAAPSPARVAGAAT